MNGKNILIGLSYIDRKYIEESEEDMRPENVYEDYVFLSGQPYHYYHRLGSGTEFSSILDVHYDTYYGTWMLEDFESGTEMTQITEERAKEIMASFPRISLEMKSVREFPLD